jgi:hypothetical protein
LKSITACGSADGRHRTGCLTAVEAELIRGGSRYPEAIAPLARSSGEDGAQRLSSRAGKGITSRKHWLKPLGLTGSPCPAAAARRPSLISIKEIETLNAYLGTITKRPRVRGPLFFLCFSRGRRTQPNLARVPLLYVPFDFFLAFFFMTLFLAVGPLSQSKQWQQADERGVNRSWQRGNNLALLTALDASPRSLRRAGCTAQIGWLEGVGRAILSRIKATEVTHELSHPRPRGPSVRSSFRALGRRTCCARCHPADRRWAAPLPHKS